MKCVETWIKPLQATDTIPASIELAHILHGNSFRIECVCAYTTAICIEFIIRCESAHTFISFHFENNVMVQQQQQ